MADAEVAVFAMGSLLGTIKDTVDEMREKGVKIGVVGLKCYRPFPFEAVRKALANVRSVVVIERMVSAGCGGALELDVMRALRGLDVTQHSVIAGLGGRAVTKASLHKVFDEAVNGKLPTETYFLDLDVELVERQLEREAKARHTGPLPEALNRDVNDRKLARGEEI